ncbi:S-glutathione dehydrogenase [Leucosporidium creatinivorum]|uniref:S-glutathione dehydrogenase n=1 Tax=Leucosporidium creatinivorum TaxID=106004 RepID=A0A1Y2EVZ6_9BASI|nr:S-glutathione dehydrogenase [Leucosporidium creatinivorum]
MTSTSTQAYVLAAKDAPFVLQVLELDEPQPNEVLVEVVACGICHTDLAVQNGSFPSPFPSTVGHEGSGKVVKVGTAVTRVQPGDEVLLSFSHCSECGSCQEDHPAACDKFGECNFGRIRNTAIGGKASGKSSTGEEVYGTFFGQSTFAKHALVVENSVVKVPAGTDLVQLAPLGCGLQTGAGAVINKLAPSSSSSILITGLGAVGFGALFAAAHLKLETIVVVDIVPSRLELAKSLGATHAFNGMDKDVVEQVKAVTKYGGGVNYAVECTGNVRVLKTAYDATANRGHVVSCGTPGPGNPVPIDIFANVIASKTYSGLSEGDSNPPVFIPFLIELFNKGKFPVDKISKTFKFEDLEGALHAMHSGETIKPILVMQ